MRFYGILYLAYDVHWCWILCRIFLHTMGILYHLEGILPFIPGHPRFFLLILNKKIYIEILPI